MKYSLFWCFVFMLTASAGAATVPHLEWIQTYDSPAHDYDTGRGVAVDGAGNVYVTGYEARPDLGQDYNIWLRKYDTNGNTLWTQTYDDPAHYGDAGYGVALDAAGNVYVTGCEYGPDFGQSANIWLRKYDTNGNALWTQTYDSPAHYGDAGYGVALDGAGNVYVTGCEYRPDLGQEYNIWLRKYDTNGNTLWTQTYDSPANHYDKGYGVALDGAGNVYVTGCEYRSDLGQYYNTWLRKYDTNGNTLWTQTYDSSAHYSDTGHGVALDAAGNVYVTGYEERYDPGLTYHIWLRKYDTDGNTLWTQTYDSPAHGDAIGLGVVLDASGNVYVTGYETRPDLGQEYNIWLRKYDTNGNTLWTETYDGSGPGTPISTERGYGVAVNTAGMVYVTGESNGDIILLKYAQIPEPGTGAMIVSALAGFAGMAFRRMRR